MVWTTFLMVLFYSVFGAQEPLITRWCLYVKRTA